MTVSHLNTTKCCGHTFTAKDIRPPLRNAKATFGNSAGRLWGGHAQWFSEAACPECGRKYRLWLQPVAHTYKVLTISAVDAPPGNASAAAEGKPFDVETATRDELRAWLKEHEIKYFGGASDEQLRELVRGALFTA